MLDIRYIRFLFVGEGSFDSALRKPLEDLCIWCGADEAVGVAPDLRRTQTESLRVIDKVRHALRLEPGADLLFVHRDADAPDPSPRYAEIESAISELELSRSWVAVVPVQTTEAWALMSESAIRRAADNPNGTNNLEAPPPSRVEEEAEPKKRLEQLLIKASELSGRHLDRFKKNLAKRKRRLIRQLDITGPVSEVPAWQRLKENTRSALENIHRGRS